MATQIAPPHSPRNPRNSRGKLPLMSQEDIGSVLERFHQWAGHQPEPVRELSFEEAVARSHRCVYDDEEFTGPPPVRAAAAPVPAPPPPPIPFPIVKEPPANKPVNKPSSEAPAKAGEALHPLPDPDQPAAADTPSAPAEPQAKAATRKKSSTSTAARAKKKRSASKAAANADSEKPRTAQRKPPAADSTSGRPEPATALDKPDFARPIGAAAASAYAEVLRVANTPEADPLPEATFAEVLVAQIRPPQDESAAAANVAQTMPEKGANPAPAARAIPAEPAVLFAVPPLPDDAPAVHLTVRLALSEREALRGRAHDLGITPAAYVRQCALEVDSLRNELEHARLVQAQVSADLARAHAEAQTAKNEAALCLSTPTPHRREKESEWFTRLRNFVFPRKAKAQAVITRA